MRKRERIMSQTHNYGSQVLNESVTIIAGLAFCFLFLTEAATTRSVCQILCKAELDLS